MSPRPIPSKQYPVLLELPILMTVISHIHQAYHVLIENDEQIMNTYSNTTRTNYFLLRAHMHSRCRIWREIGSWTPPPCLICRQVKSVLIAFSCSILGQWMVLILDSHRVKIEILGWAKFPTSFPIFLRNITSDCARYITSRMWVVSLLAGFMLSLNLPIGIILSTTWWRWLEVVRNRNWSAVVATMPIWEFWTVHPSRYRIALFSLNLSVWRLKGDSNLICHRFSFTTYIPWLETLPMWIQYLKAPGKLSLFVQ